MKIRIVRQIRDDAALRRSFLRLAQGVFGLSFEEWYQNGYWTDRYVPYAAVDGDRVAANASVNVMDFVRQGKPCRLVQIGTVMTDPAYRGRGLAGALIRRILSDWADVCDGVYLFANSTALDFYPRFGFARVEEFQHSAPLVPAERDFRRLDLHREEERALLFRCYERSNPFSALAFTGNKGLLMFYCGGFLSNSVYYSPRHDVVCVMETQGSELLCYDLFGGQGCSWRALLNAAAPAGVTRAVLGFTPLDAQGLELRRAEGDDALFALKGKGPLFPKEAMMFPLLSHA